MAARVPWLAHASPSFTTTSCQLLKAHSRISRLPHQLNLPPRLFILQPRYQHRKPPSSSVFLPNIQAKSQSNNGAADHAHNKSGIRVRFAPSPTGNLHVGGARTALFNYLFAKSQGGTFILRIEDTDLERSTREFEEALLRDLQWLGLEWDEGPYREGSVGPYRQSERNSLYQKHAEQLLASGQAYRCFCTDEELEAMREEAKMKNLPPIYSGKWSTASPEEVELELVKGTPYTYRFRVADQGFVKIDDLVRGEVCWSLDTLGDFVIMRSNGQPVYNFCAAVDDAMMEMSHVIRAEEHLPNTLRQVLIYQALGFPLPKFGHVSLILAPDRTKLSKRHGATSVGQFKDMGFLPQAMVNYLALLGWNDGTEDEIFTVNQLVERFSIERVTKSAAIFDKAKLQWVNGQHLRALPSDELTKLIGDYWKQTGLIMENKGQFVKDAVELLKNGMDLVSDAEKALADLLSYPLSESLRCAGAKEVVNDSLFEVAEAVLSAYDKGELQDAIKAGHDGWQKWVKSVGKSLKRKGKRLFMPIRLLLTGKTSGPDIGGVVGLLYSAENCGMIKPQAGFVTLDDRISILRGVKWQEVANGLELSSNSPESVTVLSH